MNPSVVAILMASRMSTSPVWVPRSKVAVHDHAVCVYDSERELLMDLDHFLREGLVAQEVTAMVHAFENNDAARKSLGRGIADLDEHCTSQDLLLARHADVFEHEGRIDPDQAVGVVAALTSDARVRGRAGSRVFVDASKHYLTTGRKDEWFAFESRLGPTLQANTSLVCAYDAKHLRDPDTLARVLATHAYRFESPHIREI